MAHKVCSFAKNYFSGDEKAEKLIKWGKKFENELEYELSMEYYRDAF